MPVQVYLTVKLKDGYDEGFYRKQLNQDLCRYLSPWAYDNGADIVIGGRIYANLLIDFVKSQPYIDDVTDLNLVKIETGSTDASSPPIISQGAWIGTARPEEVLVSARKHFRRLLTGGIDSMTVELDFAVAEDESSITF